MIETFLASIGEAWQPQPIETAIRAFEQWYVGDGAYGDGAEFHWDYYNSFVIQPFLLDVLEHIGKVSNRWAEPLGAVRQRARRYAAVQERLIAPDGSYPAIGRSITYRCGAFQLLAQMALRDELPEDIKPPQVRAALTAVIRRTLGAADTFDADGWLRVGLAGHQPGLAEPYISTGSLYLCTFCLFAAGVARPPPVLERAGRGLDSTQNLVRPESPSGPCPGQSRQQRKVDSTMADCGNLNFISARIARPTETFCPS